MPLKFQEVLGGSHILNSGYDIPNIGLGTSRINEGGEVEVSVRAALQNGYRLFDTAHAYENEEEIGNVLEKALPELKLKREDIFITTKVVLRDADPAGTVERQVAESLHKLRTNYLDLVLIHYPREHKKNVSNDLEAETNARTRKAAYQKLEELKEKGAINSIGVSSYEIYHLQELFTYAKIKPAVNQVEYHPYYIRSQLKHYCESNGIFFQAFSSLLVGDKQILAEKAVKDAAERHNVSPQIILCAFALATGVGIIPKSTTPHRIAENLKQTTVTKLSANEVEALQSLDRNKVYVTNCKSWNVL